MKLVLSVSAIGEQAEGRCPWMWIDLSPTLAQKALERIGVFRLAEEKDDDVIELYYVSLEATFFNPWLAAAETEQEDEGIAIEDLLEQLCADDRERAEVPDVLTIPEWATVSCSNLLPASGVPVLLSTPFNASRRTDAPPSADLWLVFVYL
jgi:hypothetical protein